MQIGFYFGVQDQSTQASLGSYASGAAYLGIAGGLISTIANNDFLGGTATIQNKIGWILSQGKTYFDLEIPLTDEIRTNGIVQLPFNVISVFGAFTSPLNLSSNQQENIGAYTSSVFPAQGAEEGTLSTLNSFIIDGGTLFNGKFVSPAFDPDVSKKLTSQEVFNQNNIFLQILRDPRLYVVRGDNQSIPCSYCLFPINPYNFNDVNSS
jgi:hypothetical protein